MLEQSFAVDVGGSFVHPEEGVAFEVFDVDIFGGECCKFLDGDLADVYVGIGFIVEPLDYCLCCESLHSWHRECECECENEQKEG